MLITKKNRNGKLITIEYSGKKKNYDSNIHVKIEKEKRDRLNEYCKNHNIDYGKLIRKYIDELLGEN